MMRSTTSYFLVLGVLAACGDDRTTPRDVSADDVADSRTDTSGDSADGSADTSIDAHGDDALDGADVSDVPDSQLDTQPDTQPDTELDTRPPEPCEAGAACNALLDADGRCPDTCVTIDDRLRCRGEVVHGVCHLATPIDGVTEEVDFGDYRVTPIQWPVDAVIGTSYPFELRVHNDTDAPLVVPFSWKRPDTFSFDNASWLELTSFTLAPGGDFTLSADITARVATVLAGGNDLIVTFRFGDNDNYEPRATVHFPATAGIDCGGEHFPPMYCPDESNCYANQSFYVTAMCCDDVFFPGVLCCSDADCVGASCVDGRCLSEAPSLSSASSPPLGNQRVVLVLVDSHPEFADDPCADRSAEVADTIALDTVGAWYDELATRRFGRPTMHMRWTVLGGVATTDFLGDGPNDFTTFSQKLDAWLGARGCPILGEYDKLIVSASTVDLQGFGGIYYDRGEIAVMSPWQPYLLAHELGHAFGATDRYLDLSGQLIYLFALMGVNVHGTPFPEDAVLWGELGYADLDRNGVLDIAEHAAFPSSFDVADLSATLTTKGTVEIAWRFVGLEDGHAKDVVVNHFHIDIPAAQHSADVYTPGRVKRVVFDGSQVDLDALRAAGSIVVGLRADHHFTARDWQPVVLPLDIARNVAITIAE